MRHVRKRAHTRLQVTRATAWYREWISTMMRCAMRNLFRGVGKQKGGK